LGASRPFSSRFTSSASPDGQKAPASSSTSPVLAFAVLPSFSGTDRTRELPSAACQVS